MEAPLMIPLIFLMKKIEQNKKEILEKKIKDQIKHLKFLNTHQIPLKVKLGKSLKKL